MTEVRGLCPASTAILHTLVSLQLWLHRPTQEARSDNPPVLAQHAEQGAFPSTANILPRHGVLAWNPAHVQLERNRVGEPSLFSEENCLSLHATIRSQGSKSGN